VGTAKDQQDVILLLRRSVSDRVQGTTVVDRDNSGHKEGSAKAWHRLWV
jgi:hypothetical protein